MYELKRWARRKGRTVQWGNVIGPYSGQSFEEEFASVAEAKEREQQALAGEAITADREPVALSRKEKADEKD